MWLGIETTTPSGGLALVDEDGSVRYEIILPVTTARHSQKILPAVKAALDAMEIDGRDLSGIGVSIGPGSYTGLRIGISTASGLANGWNIPLKGVPTLRVLNMGVICSGPVLSCIRARKNEVYACVFKSSSPDSEILLPPGVYMVSTVVEFLKNISGIHALGSGRSEMKGVQKIKWLPGFLDVPRPAAVTWLAIKMFTAEGGDRELKPLYLRGFMQKALENVP